MDDTNNSEYLYNLAVSYRDGVGGNPKDLSEAFKYFDLAAQKGYIPAIREVGTMYVNGDGTAPNAELGFKYIKSAADEMDANSVYRLALLYEKGHGVKKDLYEALRLMGFAAGMGLSGAAEDADRIEEIIDEERVKKLRSRPINNLDVSDVDVEAACCKTLMDVVINKDIFVCDTIYGPKLMGYDDKDNEVPLDACPFCKKKIRQVPRDAVY
ncbi:MAG: sel1 repeat family protein [archaeon]|nr:sel1 repeat family protein [archaeon]